MLFGLENKDRDHIAVISDQGITLDYGNLCDRISSLAEAVPGRQLVFCLCRNVPASLIGYLGLIEGGHVPLLLSSGIDSELLDALNAAYRPGFIWLPKDMAEAFSYTEPVYSLYDYVLLKTGSEAYEMHADLALLLTTSGSTGSPKLVRVSRKNLEASASQIASYLELDASERPVTTLAMNYVYGLSVINSHLLAGACILMTASSMVSLPFWEFYNKHQPTSISGVPYTYGILKRFRFLKGGKGSLRSMTQAGGRLPEKLQQDFGQWAKENGVRFYVMYGQTEATSRMAYLPWEICLQKIGSIGIAVPGGRFELKDDTGRVITEDNRAGELIYHGANVTLGYALSPDDLKKGDERHGVLETGDLAIRDSEGYYTIVGRLKRFIKIYGSRIGLDECERLLCRQFPDCDFACTGCDDELKIYLTDPGYRDQAAEWLCDKLKISERAVRVHVIEQIPVNDNGKRDYSALKGEILS